MEIWLVSIVCVVLAATGCIVGGVSVYMLARYYRRLSGSRMDASDIECEGAQTEDCELRMTAAELGVMRRISCGNGKICIPLELPDPCFRLPFPPSLPVCRSQSSDSTLPLAIPDSASDQQRDSDAASTSSTHDVNNTLHAKGTHIGMECASQQQQQQQLSAGVHSTITWSAPIDDRHQSTQSIQSINGHRSLQMPKDMPCSHDEENFGITSCATCPSSPLTLASLCSSSEFIFVPTSPSCSSLFEHSNPDTLSRTLSSGQFQSESSAHKTQASSRNVAGSTLFIHQPNDDHRNTHHSRHSISTDAVRSHHNYDTPKPRPRVMPGIAAVLR